MVKAGAKVDLISESGESALSVAIENNDKDLTQFLLQRDAPIFPSEEHAE